MYLPDKYTFLICGAAFGVTVSSAHEDSCVLGLTVKGGDVT